MPAFAQTTSSWPCSATTRSTAAAHAAASVTSSSIVSGVGVIAAAVLASASLSRSANTGRAPLRTRPRAVAAPIPRAPPVIRTTFSLNDQWSIAPLLSMRCHRASIHRQRPPDKGDEPAAASVPRREPPASGGKPNHLEVTAPLDARSPAPRLGERGGRCERLYRLRLPAVEARSSASELGLRCSRWLTRPYLRSQPR